jgi:hypothetical protein
MDAVRDPLSITVRDIVTVCDTIVSPAHRSLTAVEVRNIRG